MLIKYTPHTHIQHTPHTHHMHTHTTHTHMHRWLSVEPLTGLSLVTSGPLYKQNSLNPRMQRRCSCNTTVFEDEECALPAPFCSRETKWNIHKCVAFFYLINMYFELAVIMFCVYFCLVVLCNLYLVRRDPLNQSSLEWSLWCLYTLAWEARQLSSVLWICLFTSYSSANNGLSDYDYMMLASFCPHNGERDVGYII